MKRRIWQTVSAIFLNFPLLGEMKWLCLPVLNCHSCPWALAACPIGVIGHFGSWWLFPFIALGTIGLLGTIFGRAICGWICPFGLLQDVLHKIPSPKWVVRPWMKYVKYVLLVGSVILVPILFGLDTPAFFCKLCPAATLESFIPRTLADKGFAGLLAGWLRLTVFVGFLVLAVVSLRSFCKIFCPIGAFLAICNRFSGFSIKHLQKSCPSCDLCLERCPMDISIEEFHKNKSPLVVTTPDECILCLQCTKSCRKNGMRFSFWGLFGGAGPVEETAKLSEEKTDHE